MNHLVGKNRNAQLNQVGVTALNASSPGMLFQRSVISGDDVFRDYTFTVFAGLGYQNIGITAFATGYLYHITTATAWISSGAGNNLSIYLLTAAGLYMNASPVVALNAPVVFNGLIIAKGGDQVRSQVNVTGAPCQLNLAVFYYRTPDP